jgi:response regulator RpfG family c-di-GMP phosphodiesterase
MDRWMPALDGFEAAQRMRQIPELGELPIVTVSASVSKEDQAQSGEVGIDAFLPKPVSWPRLATLLQECLALEWDYGKTIEVGEKEGEAILVPPPAEEMEILLNLARRGDMRAIRERTAHIVTLGEQYVPFARRLRELAESFETRQIRTLIERYMEEDQ